ncbi:hypothetical protein BDM02DRAFT_2063047 [Thelephora ganbajun]|uniref:Uncharacterized protein n=1 Tax=Thelephora ganbajun TaxID=370292 RepID=A0ACB6YYR8_THEGA|nr:hypothetical protein BDM02DRAFT_2063047 [Thelephora ganbajun]
MAASFATYASQFLTKQPDSLSSSQPMFFSFSSDNESIHGNNRGHDLDDLDDPHLRASRASTTRPGLMVDDDDDDPYLRLDEEDPMSRNNAQSIPLIASGGDFGPESSKGWLAHHASPLRDYPSDSSSARSSTSSDDGSPPQDILSHQPGYQRQQQQPQRPSIPPPPRVSLSLTQSLLPRDGNTRPRDVFSLPDPRHVSRARRKYNDSIWTILWCSSLTPYNINLPYTTFLHTVPLLCILITLSAAVSYLHIFLLQIFIKPVMIATSFFIPVALFISALWAFIGSFMWDGDTEPTWGETVGLRLFAIVPLVLALLTARRLVDLPRDIHTTSSMLTLTTRLLQNNPFLLGLSPLVLLASLIVSIPFLTLTFRLLLIGYPIHPRGNPSAWEWHVRGWANWLIALVVTVWVWSWCVGRGVLRVTCAAVVGAWYFGDPTLPSPPPTSTHTIHAAIMRATQPSFGSIVLAGLILTGVRLLGFLTIALRMFPAYLPLPVRPFLQPLVFASAFAVGYLENATSSLSTYALAYLGLTGDPFFPSARRAAALTAAVNASVSKYRRKFKNDPPFTMLTYAPLTLTLPFALTTYLFVAHTLGAPQHALSAAILGGGVTALVGLFCVGLVDDTVDALYICYCVDQQAGQKRRPEVFSAFEYETKKPQQQPARPVPGPSGLQQTRPKVSPSQLPATGTTPIRQHRLQSPLVTERERAPTPDPFANSPLDDEDDAEIGLGGPLQPQAVSSVPPPPLPSSRLITSPIKSSTHVQRGYDLDDDDASSQFPGKTSMSRSVGKSDIMGSKGDDDIEESQLFPGSDLF